MSKLTNTQPSVSTGSSNAVRQTLQILKFPTISIKRSWPCTSQCNSSMMRNVQGSVVCAVDCESFCELTIPHLFLCLDHTAQSRSSAVQQSPCSSSPADPFNLRAVQWGPLSVGPRQATGSSSFDTNYVHCSANCATFALCARFNGVTRIT